MLSRLLRLMLLLLMLLLLMMMSLLMGWRFECTSSSGSHHSRRRGTKRGPIRHSASASASVAGCLLQLLQRLGRHLTPARNLQSRAPYTSVKKFPMSNLSREKFADHA